MRLSALLNEIINDTIPGTSYDVNKPEVPNIGPIPSILLTRFYPWCIVPKNQVEVPKSKIFLVARFRWLAL
jgi:hypothetical protein